MITQETVQKLVTQYKTNELNVIREYFQHLFLFHLYQIEGSEKILFKGGTALRIIYGSPRFSEDLDFSAFNAEVGKKREFIENIFTKTLAEIEKSGIKVELGPKPGPTAEGYYGDALFSLPDNPNTHVSINVSARNGRDIKGEVISIANDFIFTYTLYHLPTETLVDEKVFSALLERGKPRDFYDLYFILRKNLLTPGQKRRLTEVKEKIMEMARKIDFADELSVFLPKDQHVIISDFYQNLTRELNSQLGN